MAGIKVPTVCEALGLVLDGGPTGLGPGWGRSDASVAGLLKGTLATWEQPEKAPRLDPRPSWELQPHPAQVLWRGSGGLCFQSWGGPWSEGLG